MKLLRRNKDFGCAYKFRTYKNDHSSTNLSAHTVDLFLAMVKSALGLRIASLLDKYPFVKNVVIPLALLYFLARPVKSYLFGDSTKKESAVVKEPSSVYKAEASAKTAKTEKASSTADFIHEHLEVAKTKTLQDYKAVLKVYSPEGPPNSNTSPSATTLEYRKRLNLEPTSVVTGE